MAEEVETQLEQEDLKDVVQKVVPFPVRLERVECTLPGYEHLTWAYVVSNYYETEELLRDEWPNCTLRHKMLILAWFVKGVEGWNFTNFEGKPLPAPTADDPSTFKPVLYNLDLLRWVRWDGYRLAMEQSLGNSGAGSKKRPKKEHASVDEPKAGNPEEAQTQK
jgi:hypothetical protein